MTHGVVVAVAVGDAECLRLDEDLKSARWEAGSILTPWA